MALQTEKEKHSSARPKDSPSLPQDVIWKILSWVPAKTLGICRCVCKQWHALTQDQGFLMQHASQAAWEKVPASDQAILQDGAIEKFVTRRTCLGLMLQLKDGGRKYRVKNPTTRRVLDLPGELPEEVEGCSSALFYNEQLQEFKVACIYKAYWRSGNISGAIISLEKDEKWRPLELHHPDAKEDYQYAFFGRTRLSSFLGQKDMV